MASGPSVRERLTFFEQLAPHDVTVIKEHAEDTKPPPVPTTTPPLDTLRLIPPQKPKRTFEHNHYLISQQTSLVTMSSSSNNSKDSINSPEPETNMFDCGFSQQEVPFYAVSPLTSRKHRSQEQLYAVPISEEERIRRNGRSHHQFSLYYAVTDVVQRPDEIKPHLNRKFAFKKAPKSDRPSPSTKLKRANADLKLRASRAQLVRKSTLLHKELEAAFRSRPQPQLFEAAFLINIHEVIDSDSSDVKRKPEVDFCFPTGSNTEFSRNAELFYPDYSYQYRYCKGDFWNGDEEFVVALTVADSSRRYAYCVKYIPQRKDDDDAVDGQYPCVFAIISPIRNSVFYMDLVRNAYAYSRKSTELLEVFLNSVFRHQYPEKPGASLIVLEKLSAGLTKRIEIKNYGQVMGKSGSAAIISRLSPEVTVCLVAALLGEQRVLIAGNSVGDTDMCHPAYRPMDDKVISCSTTRVVQMLEALIRPFSWPHTFVPIVPDNLIALCDNPTPYLMGILRSNLNKVKDLIIEDTEDVDKRQMDFVFVDVDAGLVNPSPKPLCQGMDVETWRLETAVDFCERLGWPRKMSTSLIRGFREAILCSPAAVADLKVENTMLKWFSQLFGHYRFVGAHQTWDNESRRLLVAGQPDKSYRPYLSYLIETAMFEEWILSRKPRPNCTPPVDVLPGSEEDLNLRIDKFWITEFNSVTPKELRKFVRRVGNILHLKK